MDKKQCGGQKASILALYLSTRILKVNAINEQLNGLCGDFRVMDLDSLEYRYNAVSYTWDHTVSYDT